jgi:Tannase and feruloyl esterase
MVFSQNFPDDYEGIIAGDPVYDLESIALSEVYGVEAMAAIAPAPIGKLANGSPVLYPAFPEADQKLFTRALLAACDKLDGAVDGVVDDLPACRATFDPATFVFPDTGQSLQCAGAKNVTCLSSAQIGAIKKINQGPRIARPCRPRTSKCCGPRSCRYNNARLSVRRRFHGAGGHPIAQDRHAYLNTRRFRIGPRANPLLLDDAGQSRLQSAELRF